MPANRTVYFSELIDLKESTLDGDTFTVQGVTLIRPGFSTNTDKQGRPRYYSKDLLKQSAKVFEGTRAFANHPRRSDEKELPERDIRDIVGYYVNVKASDGGTVTGDLKVVGKAQEWLWPLIKESVENNPTLVQTSINALGQTSLGEAEGRKAVMVESIISSNSVDVVTTGAAGGTFSGALLASDGDTLTNELLAALSFDEWRESRPEFVDKLKGEWKTTRETDALKESASQIEKLKSEITRLTETGRAEESELANYRRASLADRLLEESALPIKLRPAVRTQLLSEADESGMLRVLEGEQAKYKAAPKAKIEIQKPVVEDRIMGAKLANPAAKILQLDESKMVKPGESAEEYKTRYLKESQK